jgi:hypothetical protein
VAAGNVGLRDWRGLPHREKVLDFEYQFEPGYLK